MPVSLTVEASLPEPRIAESYGLAMSLQDRNGISSAWPEPPDGGDVTRRER